MYTIWYELQSFVMLKACVVSSCVSAVHLLIWIVYIHASKEQKKISPHIYPMIIKLPSRALQCAWGSLGLQGTLEQVWVNPDSELLLLVMHTVKNVQLVNVPTITWDTGRSFAKHRKVCFLVRKGMLRTKQWVYLLCLETTFNLSLYVSRL